MQALLSKLSLLLFCLAVNCISALAETRPHADIHVYVDQPDGSFEPVWSYFGYDEPNYTYAPNGRKLLSELAALSAMPVYVRMHNLLTSGDGSASLKWGSTNIYSEGPGGKAVYDWAILDRIFDTLNAIGIRPLVEIGFMPEALSTHPEPYRHNFPQGTIFTGWAYPPRDYERWAEIVFQFVRHLRHRFGDSEVKSCLWEVWNEPDIGYWQGTREEYFKLYDFTSDAVLKALPEARVGGPHSTGPRHAKAAEFLRMFLNHCARERNYATGKTGAHLNFIAFHAKGSPLWRGDHVQMGIGSHLASIEQGFQIISSFPEWRRTPVLLGESDPEGCAACSAQDHPENSYRNGTLYAAYTTEILQHTLALARREHIRLLGSVTWAFEFENQPYFTGLRELASAGLDKPVLNAFRMFGLLGSQRLKVNASSALTTEQVVHHGVREQPDINVIATRKDREVEVLAWQYHDDDLLAPPVRIELSIQGLPLTNSALREHFRVDANHSNAFSAWKAMGSPPSPSAEQYESLQAAGQLQLLDSPEWISLRQGTAHLQLILPRQALSLIRISW
jgi:xylan 1,4-beta-xylosidase